MTILEILQSQRATTAIYSIAEDRVTHANYSYVITNSPCSDGETCHQDRLYRFVWQNGNFKLVKITTNYKEISISGGNSLSIETIEEIATDFTIDGIKFINGQPQV